MQWRLKRIAMRCDVGKIHAKAGIRAKIGISGWLRKAITGDTEISLVIPEYRYPGAVGLVRGRGSLFAQGDKRNILWFPYGKISENPSRELLFRNSKRSNGF